MNVQVEESVTLSPEQLAIKSQAGCPDSFEKLIELFEARIFHFIYRLVGNHHDAQDLTQDTFVKAFNNIMRYDSKYPFASWIYTIARRVAANHHRSQKHAPSVSLDQESACDFEADSPSVENEMDDRNESLWEIAKQLKPSYYQVLWLRYGEDFSIQEVARIMEMNSIGVRVLLHRARNVLSKKIKSTRYETIL